jgi:hypothetical protein
MPVQTPRLLSRSLSTDPGGNLPEEAGTEGDELDKEDPQHCLLRELKLLDPIGWSCR